MSTTIRAGNQYVYASLTGRTSGTFRSQAWGLAEHGRRGCGMSVSLRRTLRDVGVCCSWDRTMRLTDLLMGRCTVHWHHASIWRMGESFLLNHSLSVPHRVLRP